MQGPAAKVLEYRGLAAGRSWAIHGAVFADGQSGHVSGQASERKPLRRRLFPEPQSKPDGEALIGIPGWVHEDDCGHQPRGLPETGRVGGQVDLSESCLARPPIRRHGCGRAAPALDESGSGSQR